MSATSASRLTIGLVATTLLVTASLGGAPLAAARAVPRQLPALKLGFRPAGRAIDVITGPRYAAVQTPGGLVLHDDFTGQRVALNRSGCYLRSSRILGDVLAFSCGAQDAVELYFIDSSTWRPIELSPGIEPSCGPFNGCSARLVGAGSFWVEFVQGVCPMYEHCSSANVFQDVYTGAVRADPTRAHVIADLDDPQLAHPLCAPLTYPEPDEGDPPATIWLEGRFAVVMTTLFKFGTTPFYLRECGSRQRQLIASTGPLGGPPEVAIGRHAIVWEQSGWDLTVEYLPSRRRFRIPLPAGVAAAAIALALTDHDLYLTDGNTTGGPGKLWRAQLPPRPPTH